MNITEKMVERALDRWADTSDGEGGLHRMRGALEAAFAAVTVIPGTDVFAAAEKESEVMPPDSERIFNREPSPATSPGGAIAGASGKFRKKPVIIEAFQYEGLAWTQGTQPDWFNEAVRASRIGFATDGSSFWIATPEGRMLAVKGDWIIRGVEVEIYPCKPSIFEKSYEPVPASSLDEVERCCLRIDEAILTPICARKMADVAGYEPGKVVAIEDNRVLVHVDGEDLWFAINEVYCRAAIAAMNRARQPSRAIADIVAERKRQIEVEGWTSEHDDDAHDLGDLALAAAAYAYGSAHTQAQRNAGKRPAWWPWAAHWWKPKDQRRDLVKAGALIIAEIERLDRARAFIAKASEE